MLLLVPLILEIDDVDGDNDGDDVVDDDTVVDTFVDDCGAGDDDMIGRKSKVTA